MKGGAAKKAGAGKAPAVDTEVMTIGVGLRGRGKRSRAPGSDEGSAATRPRRAAASGKESPTSTRASPRSVAAEHTPHAAALDWHAAAETPHADATPLAADAPEGDKRPKSKGVDLFCYEQMDSSFVGFKARSAHSSQATTHAQDSHQASSSAYSAGATVHKGKKASLS